MTAGVIDLTDLDLFTDGDPHEVWAWLRDHRPVFWNATADGGFWALTRYDDVSAGYLDSTGLSSRRGTVMGGSYRSDSDSSSGQMLIASDLPAHRYLRQVVHRAFGQPMLDRAAGFVRQYLGEALDRMVADGGGDFAVDVAPVLPAGLLAAMFGLGRADAFRLLDLTRTMIGFQDPHYHGTGEETTALVNAQVEILELMSDLVERRRREPADDLPGILVGASLNGRPMRESELLYNCLNVAVGGDETTPFTASAAVQTLAEHPEQAARLLADPGLLPTAVEEVFRWTSTNAYVQRTATRDLMIGDQLIEAGQFVTLWNAAANRDERQFPHADRFDVGRTPNHHLAFGVGIHRCIGSGAARMEISLFMDEIVRRGLTFRPAGPPRRLRSNFMLGHTHLPVTVSSRTRITSIDHEE